MSIHTESESAAGAPQGHPGSMPVILGTGLTGIAISRTLSARGIPHWLVGRPPGTAPPKLGESLNGEGTVDFLQFFPEYRDYWYEKNTLELYIGPNRVTCDLDGSRYPVARWFCRLTGFPIFPCLIHVDRVGFDTALFEDALARPECTHLDLPPGQTQLAVADARIDALEIPGRPPIRPSFLFDASGFESVVPKALGMAPTPLGEPRVVAFTHFQREPNPPGTAARNPWELATSLVRLDRERDGVDGVGWCIPLGRSLSVGISVPETGEAGTGGTAGGNGAGGEAAAGDDGSELLERLAEAFARRGLDYRRRYPVATRVARLRHSHYVHERLSGPNWMLTGPTVLQIWFPSGAGVSTSLMGALSADKILRNPARNLPRYERLIRHFVTTHWTHNGLWTRNGRELERGELAAFSDKLVNSTFLRLSAYVPLRNSAVYRPAAWLIHRLLGRGWVGVRRHCAITPIPGLAAGAAWAKSPALAHPAPASAAEVETVRRLFSVISGELPMGEARGLLHPDVRTNMDAQAVRGWGWWFCWVRLIRAWGALRYRGIALRGVFEARAGGMVEARGQWVGQRRLGGGLTVAPGVALKYRLMDGRIEEIWTSRANYRFLFGRGLESRLGFRSVLAVLGVMVAARWVGERLMPRATAPRGAVR